MALTHSQKKFLKKNAGRMSVSALSAALGIPEKDIAGYLSGLWGEKKFRRRINPVTQMFSPSVFRPEKHLRILLALLILTAAAYANSVGGGFISDDRRYLVDNPLIRSFGFVTSTPVTVFKALVNYLTYLAFGLSPWAFHVVNILFHALSVVSVFALLGMFVGWQVAAAAAALTAVHPVFTESVSWIGGGGYAMYGSLFLLSFALYVGSGTSRVRYVLSFFVFVLSLLSSEKAIPLLLAFPLYEITAGTLRGNFRKVLPFVIAGFVWTVFVFGLVGYGSARLEALESDFSIRGYYNPLVQIPVAVSSYIGLLLFPKDLSFFYSRLQFPLPEFLLRVTVTLAFVILSFLAAMKNRLALFFLLMVPLTLAPSLTPLTVAWVVAERYAYLAAVFLIAAFAVFIHGTSPKLRRILLILILLAVPLYLTRTVIRNFDWTSEDTLWFATYKTAPYDPRVHNNIGEYYMKRKDYEKAEQEFKTAISFNPARPAPYYNLGLLYYQTGRQEQAVTYLVKSTEVRTSFADGYRVLASVHYEREEYQKALDNVLKLRELEPGNAMVYLNLGMIYEKLGDKVLAAENYRKAVTLDPENAAARKALEQLSPSP